MLSLDWNIIWTFVNIIVLFLFFKKFLFGPVTAIMDKRTKAIEDSFQEAENKNTEALAIKTNYEQMLENADEEAAKIIKEAKERASLEHDRQIKETQLEAAKIIEEANKTIELERKRSLQGVQSEIAGLAMLAASKVIQKNVDDNTNKQLVGDFLKEVGASK